MEIFSLGICTLYLYLAVPEREEEALAVLGAQSINAARVDGARQVVINLLLRILLVLLPTRSDPKPI